LGDFDSAPVPTERPDAERLPTEKDDTDTHYAARRALELGCDEVVILGGLGGRLDHTLANMQTLVFLEKQGVHAVLADETTQVNVLLHGTLTVYRPEGACYCSVFPIGERAEEVTLEGLKYPLHDAVLTNVWPVGVSNEFLQDRAHISVRNGGLYILVCSKQQSDQST
jgi:thiamine pyrophosphokinase